MELEVDANRRRRRGALGLLAWILYASRLRSNINLDRILKIDTKRLRPVCYLCSFDATFDV